MKRAAMAVVMAALLAGCAEAPEPQRPTVTFVTRPHVTATTTRPATLRELGITAEPIKPVTAGAYCDRVGQMGVFKSGRAARCTSKPVGSKPRWRSA